jgi:hypothetical protein
MTAATIFANGTYFVDTPRKVKGRRKVGRPEIVENVEMLYEGGM